MKIYIATRFSNRQKALDIAAKLLIASHTIASSWIYSDHGYSGEAGDAGYNDYCVEATSRDLADVDLADALLVLTEGCEKVPGGMHIEVGYALGKGKTVFLLGPAVNIFYRLPEVRSAEELGIS